MAGSEGVSEAEVVRRAIVLYARDRLRKPLPDLVGTVRGGPADGARHHDRYIYGEPGPDAE